jgi:putative flippase GtrA
MQLSLVVPSFNEEEVLPETAARLSSLLGQLVQSGKIADSSKIYFVDDGSTDRTWAIVTELAKVNPAIRGLRLSRNCGHQIALLAGLLTVPGDAIISVDADLQDDLAAIEPMLDAHLQGCEIVFGVRSKRDTDTFMKRLTATGYYRLLDRLGVEIGFSNLDRVLRSAGAVCRGIEVSAAEDARACLERRDLLYCCTAASHYCRRHVYCHGQLWHHALGVGGTHLYPDRRARLGVDRRAHLSAGRPAAVRNRADRRISGQDLHGNQTPATILHSRVRLVGDLSMLGSIAAGHRRDLIRYLCVGVINTLVGLSTIYFCMYVLRFADVPANAVGYAAGVICSFVLNRRWTFSSDGPVIAQFFKFLVVLGVAYAGNLGTVVSLTHLGLDRYLAQAAGVVPYTAIGYLGSRMFAFRRTSVGATGRQPQQ